MKNITRLLSIAIVALSISFTSFANATFMPTDKYNFGGTVFDPLGSRQCSYEIYCDRTTGEVGIDPKHVILGDFKSAVSPNGWSGFRFTNKKSF